MLHFSAIKRRAEFDAELERQPMLLRPPGRLLLEVDWQKFDVELKPDQRDSRMFYAVLNGDPLMHSGLEQVWREIQRRRAPVLSARRIG